MHRGVSGRAITILAASSVSGLFGASREGFIEDDPCVDDVRFSFGSSATLAGQVVNGVPADVFISASGATMDTVVDAGLAVGEPVLFARNVAAIMVSTRTTVPISALGDLAGSALTVGLCVATAPCGKLADAVLAKAGTDRAKVVDTEAASVEDLVTKIDAGELDAGIVYGSDCATARESVRCVSIPSDQNSTTEYFAAALTESSSATRWLALMTSDSFQRRLTDDFGFLAP
ncbi:MAG: molybdate ABC transporter substrate-binding protein [Actinomycetota bacterium]